ncbi:MAG: DNA repair protein RadA [Oscillospiraceae bacterium]|nr:DNA repair protein RadA [Oscillospiraceae bacterium]
MKEKTVFYCTSCGNETMKWQGRCPACGQWNTIVEHKPTVTKGKATARTGAHRQPKTLKEVSTADEARFSTGMAELDRVLGGGAVRGSLVLVGGAPGIGKSTLLLQLSAYVCRSLRVLYVSGEESETQIKMRAVRLGIQGDGLYVLSETAMEDILQTVDELKPDVLVIDSIQTLYAQEGSSAPGSITQVKECTMTLMQLAKVHGITVFVVGHINKEGSIAGPKVLEHMVDCVLYFEGDRNTSYRLISAAKNRFGSTNELGVFDMREGGLTEVENPSEMLLSGRPRNAPGTCVACAMEGTRPILAEVQALVVSSSFNTPRRTTDGFDFNRATLLMAVLDKRGGLKLSGCDGYINVIGGLNISEPAADLPLVMAVASSFRDKPIPGDVAAIGEVGLTGEIRAVNQLELRLGELSRLGFRRVLIPYQGSGKILPPEGMELLRVKNIRQAIDAILE